MLQVKDVPVAFNFFNPTTDLPTGGNGSGTASFSDLLRKSSASRIDQSLAHRRGDRAEVQQRRDQPYTSNIVQTTTRHGTSHQLPRSTILQPPVTGIASSLSRMGTLPGGEMRQPHAVLNTTGIGAPMIMNHVGRREFLAQMDAHPPPLASSHFFGEGNDHRTGMFRGSQIM